MGFWGKRAARLESAEEALRKAVEAFRRAPSDDERVRLRLRIKAERVLSARVQILRDRIADAQRVTAEEARAARAREILSLLEREKKLREGGVRAILREVGIEEVALP